MNETDYHALPGLSHGLLEDLIASPSLFHGRHIARTIPRWEGSDETELGAALHQLVLEGPEVFEARTAVWRGGYTKATKKGEEPKHTMRRGTAAYAEFEESAKGKTIVSATDLDAIEKMATALHANRQSRPLLFDLPGRPEESLQWTIPLGDGAEIPCRARLDRHLHDARIIVDLKTTAALTFDDVRRQAIKLGYHRKAEWYRRGYLASTGENAREFLFVSVRSSAPHDVWVWTIDSETESIAEVEVDLALDDYRARMIVGDWSPNECAAVHQIGARPYEVSDRVREELERRRTG